MHVAGKLGQLSGASALKDTDCRVEQGSMSPNP
eukprot:CAMPEP_0174358024 /NCGR_PEP_ID=MMETSP0811_2-20130205/39403_1 /TAXON_ID=73025 ORGANISM="Eutreptiella gymnastica-like, Strain CCMP1594" /NCGR_SAMPLE_ID=MMETSP0811_2 /ASSEMBLY_ACC=CAM_ASM_000667 /LENGTH=32 /DNA_ID= /DNA_START= /DNA_END= /DNA_ORIENTATION=